MSAVRKIEPRHVHPRSQQAVDHPRRTTRWPNGADNFGVPKTHEFFVDKLSFAFLFPNGMRPVRLPFPTSRPFASLLPYLVIANSATMWTSTSTPLLNAASGILSSSPCILFKSSSASGNGTRPYAWTLWSLNCEESVAQVD